MGTQIYKDIIVFAKFGDNWEKSKIWKHIQEFGPNVVITINIFCLLIDYEHESQCVISHQPGF